MLHLLPPEVLENVLGNLETLNDLLALSHTCHFARSVVLHNDQRFKPHVQHLCQYMTPVSSWHSSLLRLPRNANNLGTPVDDTWTMSPAVFATEPTKDLLRLPHERLQTHFNRSPQQITHLFHDVRHRSLYGPIPDSQDTLFELRSGVGPVTRINMSTMSRSKAPPHSCLHHLDTKVAIIEKFPQLNRLNHMNKRVVTGSRQHLRNVTTEVLVIDNDGEAVPLATFTDTISCRGEPHGSLCLSVAVCGTYVACIVGYSLFLFTKRDDQLYLADSYKLDALYSPVSDSHNQECLLLQRSRSSGPGHDILFNISSKTVSVVEGGIYAISIDTNVWRFDDAFLQQCSVSPQEEVHWTSAEVMCG